MTAWLGDAWRVFDGVAPEPDGHVRRVLASSAAHEVVAALWPRGVEGLLHGHGAASSWLRVLSGRLEEERYVPLGGGEWRYERALLGPGATSALPPHALHRLVARGGAQALVVLSPRPARSVMPFEIADIDALRRARRAAAQDRARVGRGPSWEP